MVDFKKLMEKRKAQREPIRPEIQNLLDRGNITLAEYKTLSATHHEWREIFKALDDDAFIDRFQYLLNNCEFDRHDVSYNDGMISTYAPELFRRFKEAKGIK